MLIKIAFGTLLALLLWFFGSEWWRAFRRATASTEQGPTDQPKN